MYNDLELLVKFLFNKKKFMNRIVLKIFFVILLEREHEFNANFGKFISRNFCYFELIIVFFFFFISEIDEIL